MPKNFHIIWLLFFVNTSVVKATSFLNKQYDSGAIYSYEMNSGKVVQREGTKRSRYRIALLLDSGITNPPTTGLLYKAICLSKEMVRRGHDYTFFICNRNFKSKKQIDAFKLSGIDVHILDESRFYNLGYMEKLLGNYDFDVMQYEVPQTFLDIGVRLKRRLGVGSMLVLHDIEDELMSTLGRTAHNEILDFTHYTASHLADALATLTKTDKAKRVAKHGISEEKIFVTPTSRYLHVSQVPRCVILL